MTANGGPHPERCILVTGGAGYIGSHTSLQLLLDGYKVVLIDSFVNSCEEAVRRVVDLAGKQGQNLVLHKVGCCGFSFLTGSNVRASVPLSTFVLLSPVTK